jgi:tetratricopeptide (TPR) repeat protein
MDVVTTWNGARADALRRALRMSIEEFAGRIDLAARTVAYWRQRPGTVPKPTIQAALDTLLAQASESETAHFRLMLAEPEDRLPPVLHVSPPTALSQAPADLDVPPALGAMQPASGAGRPSPGLERGEDLHPWPPLMLPSGISASLAADEGEDEHVRRREFLALTGVAIAALETLRSQSPSAITRPEAWREARRMDAETYEGLANLVLGYRQVYRSASAVSLLAPVCGTLSLLTELAPDSGRYRDPMVSLIGQAAALASAILIFDTRDFTTAKHYLTIGVRAAQQSSDNEVLAISLACRAFHATYSGDAQTGVAFAEGALDVAAGGIHPRTHGWIAAVASEMHATLGPRGEAACMAALETAGEQLTRPMPEQPWSGIGAFDDGKLAAYRGGDLMRLGNYAGARAQLQAALDQLSPALAKHRCTAHIDLAEACAHDNELDQAVDHAVRALEIISSTRHADSLRRVEGVHAAIKASSPAQARALGSRLLEFKAVS